MVSSLAKESEMSLYLIFMGVGVAVMILSLVLDGLLDFDGDGWSVSFSAAVASFGAFMLLFENSTIPTYLSWGLSIIFSVFILVLIVFLIKTLKKGNDSEDNEFVEREELEGRKGEVIWWSDDKGEVTLLISGVSKKLSAFSFDKVNSGDEVRVLSVRKDGALEIGKES